ncbi:DUF1223 domain-containing protein [Profundibacter sp.]
MRKLAILISGMWLALAAGAIGAAAGSGPVVVELYTSQGCSSCPPADEFLGKLAKRDDVIALSLHVDYWDYIGWKDIYASPQFTKRQHAYARAAGKRMVYTPQMVVAGQDLVVGTKPGEVGRLIRAHNEIPSKVDISVKRNGDQVQITAEPLVKGLGKLVVQMVRFSEGETVRIKRGENAGRKLAYHNVVTEWSVLKTWNGSSKLMFLANIAGDDKCVIIVQAANHGSILAAARVR